MFSLPRLLRDLASVPFVAQVHTRLQSLAHALDLKLTRTLLLLRSTFSPQTLPDYCAAQDEQRREEAHDRGEPELRAAGVLQVRL